MTRIEPGGTLGVRVTRELRAAPEAVFDAFTDPERQKIWLSALGPEDGEVTTSVDLRVGGVWEATFRANPDTLVHDVQTYLEIDRPHRLVTTLISESTMGGHPMPTMVGQVALDFAPSATGTIVSAAQTGLPTPEVRDFFETVVWPGVLDRIAAHLTAR